MNYLFVILKDSSGLIFLIDAQRIKRHIPLFIKHKNLYERNYNDLNDRLLFKMVNVGDH
jgi:hypothetical protein